MEISIIILSKNEERYIGPTLDMIFRQDIDKEYEVIIIDSGSQDFTLEIARRYPAKIIEILTGEFGHGRTRNQGAQAASGEIVVFLNADATPANSYWLKGLVDNFKNDEKIVGVYSRIYPRPNCNPLRFWEILNEGVGERQVRCIDDFNSYQYMKPRDKRMFLAFQSISCAIKKDFLLKYPFENIEFGEDLEWSKRIMEKGFKIIFEPKSIVLHSHNFYYSFIETFKKYFDDARLNNRLLNIWSWQNLPMLVGRVLYKIFKDASYILSLNEGVFYKISWLFYSPIIRIAEFLGILLGAFPFISEKLVTRLSLVEEIKSE
ncbi:MAG: glycosyltransferase family 2 protein [Candidatus Omnitrophica bacterium]|nr:glycosyltransferase family 2 protein [Candidatus Omnitrophota bacterium]